MAAILISWGDTKPDQRLVNVMIEKAKSFHVINKPEFKYGPRWPAADGTYPTYDSPCWHIRDDLCTAGAGSHGLEGCQGVLEGLQEGWSLALECYPPKVKKESGRGKAKP